MADLQGSEDMNDICGKMSCRGRMDTNFIPFCANMQLLSSATTAVPVTRSHPA